jgi:uncharacterized protein (DUF2249 family)
MAREIDVDVRELTPPEPLERIMDALADLPAGDRLRIRHRREPHPLYGMLRNMGYRWQTTSHALDDFEILVWEEDRDGQDTDTS